MDRLANWTRGINVTTPTTVVEETYESNLSNAANIDELLITAPSWSIVQQDFRWIFLLHSYGFACLFFVLGFYTFFSILNLRSLISSRPHMSTINIFLCLLGASRAACLFVDPYNLKETMPRVIGSVIWDIGYPCIISAFCLVHLAFLQLTKLKFGVEKIQIETFVTFVVTAHFFFIIASDIFYVSHNYYMTKYMLQITFIVWSIIFYLFFLHSGYRINQLLRTIPNCVLTRDSSIAHQKGIVQLALLAPYSNLATSVAAALMPTLLGSKIKGPEENESANASKDTDETSQESRVTTTAKVCKIEEPAQKEMRNITVPTCTLQSPSQEQKSAVPEVYVRPPTPTPSSTNLPIITVSSPSRRSSVASGPSRRDSDASVRSSRRNSECSVRFINEEDPSSTMEYRRVTEGSPRHRIREETDRSRSPDNISRRYSENITPMGSSRELRRCSDFTHEKNRGSQFATKLRRNSDFGNRTPRRMLPPEEQRLPKVLDLSPTGSRRNSDIGIFVPPRVDSRRNSENTTYRRDSEFVHIKPLIINRRSSDISIRTLDRSPTHFQSIVPMKTEAQEKSESDSDQPDCNEKAALMNEKPKEKEKEKEEETKVRKKNLTWKNDNNMEDPENITAETNLLPENTSSEARVAGTDFTLHSILNHIAYVNRSKSDMRLRISEVNTAAGIKSELRKVLYVTCATAILGIILSFADAARIFGPYGLLAETVPYGTEPLITQYPRPLPWLLYQTLCRGLELMMSCGMTA